MKLIERAFVVSGACIAGVGLLWALGVSASCENSCGGTGFLLLCALSMLPGAILALVGALIVRRRWKREARQRPERAHHS